MEQLQRRLDDSLIIFLVDDWQLNIVATLMQSLRLACYELSNTEEHDQMSYFHVRIDVCLLFHLVLINLHLRDSVAEWLASWTQAQKGLGSNRSHDAVR